MIRPSRRTFLICGTHKWKSPHTTPLFIWSLKSASLSLSALKSNFSAMQRVKCDPFRRFAETRPSLARYENYYGFFSHWIISVFFPAVQWTQVCDLVSKIISRLRLSEKQSTPCDLSRVFSCEKRFSTATKICSDNRNDKLWIRISFYWLNYYCATNKIKIIQDILHYFFMNFFL